MALTNFFVQDGLNVNNFITANSTTLKVGTNTIINSTVIYVGNAVGFSLAANGGSLGSNGYVLTSNGTTVYWSVPAGGPGGVNTDAQFTWANVHTFNGNVVIGTSASVSANGSVGTNGQFLASNGTTVYWATPEGSSSGVDTVTMLTATGGTWF